MDNKSVKDNIARLRTSRRLSQDEAAGRMGISRQSYIAIEKGGTKILADNIARLAATFGVSPEELVLGYEPQPSTEALREERARYQTDIETYRNSIKNQQSVIEALRGQIKAQEQVISMQREMIERLQGGKTGEND